MTIDDFIDTLASIDGREPKLIEAFLVRMRAGHVVGQLGELRATDVANVLIGLNGANRAAESPRAVHVFRNLPRRLISGIESDRYLPDRVTDAHNFGEALEALIETAPEIERAFETIILGMLADDPATSLGGGGAGAAMRLSVQIQTGLYPAGAIRVDTNLSRKWGYGRTQRAPEGVYEAIFVGDDAPARLNDMLPVRRVSVSLHLPVFLALHEALYGGGKATMTVGEAAWAGRRLT